MSGKTMKQTLKQQVILVLLSITLLLIIYFLCKNQTLVLAQESNDAIPTIQNVEMQFNQLKHHGEALGWINPEDIGAIDPSQLDHYQGLVRYPGEGMPIFYVTQKDNDDPATPPAEVGGYLHVVVFGTRATNGERLRSNLLAKNLNTANTEPSSSDTWVRSIRFDGTLIVDGEILPAYIHPGSMAIVDDILFVPLDTPTNDANPTGQIVLFDLSTDRESPTPIQAISLTHKIDNLAVIRQADGTYLIWVNGDGGDVAMFYETSGTNLRDDSLDLDLLQVWHDDWPTDYDGDGESWPEGTGAHQSSTFLMQTDGTLFLLGMRHPGGAPDFGDDYADLYRVDPKPDPQVGYKLVRRSTKHFYCSYDGVDRICNFSAATNAYVSPSGQLILYSAPHDDVDAADPDFVRMGEFRNSNLNDMGTCSNYPWGPWAELYDDINFEDRSIVFDWEDRTLDDFNNFNLLDNFNDKASSVKWCAPVGCTITVYHDENYGGTAYVLPQSNGVVMIMPNLGGWSDEVSSIQFSGTCTPNTPPNVDIGNDITLAEGDTFSRIGSFTDPDNDTWHATVDYGDGSGEQVLFLNPDKTFSLSHTYSQSGTYQLIVEVIDSNSNKGSNSIEVTVVTRVYLPMVIK